MLRGFQGVDPSGERPESGVGGAAAPRRSPTLEEAAAAGSGCGVTTLGPVRGRVRDWHGLGTAARRSQ